VWPISQFEKHKASLDKLLPQNDYMENEHCNLLITGNWILDIASDESIITGHFFINIFSCSRHCFSSSQIGDGFLFI
jgi:hypothetical protein